MGRRRPYLRYHPRTVSALPPYPVPCWIYQPWDATMLVSLHWSTSLSLSPMEPTQSFMGMKGEDISGCDQASK